jgi:hypothetical protein
VPEIVNACGVVGATIAPAQFTAQTGEYAPDLVPSQWLAKNVGSQTDEQVFVFARGSEVARVSRIP